MIKLNSWRYYEQILQYVIVEENLKIDAKHFKLDEHLSLNNSEEDDIIFVRYCC